MRDVSWEQHSALYVNMMDLLYRPLRIRVQYRASVLQGLDPFDTTSLTPSVTLTNFRSWARASTSIPRGDAYGYFFGSAIGSGARGLAYNAADKCAADNATSMFHIVSEVQPFPDSQSSINWASNAVTLTHELGHNLGTISLVVSPCNHALCMLISAS